MDKNRIAGSSKQIKGAIKEVIGKIVGDAKLQIDGKAEQIDGKVQNLAGTINDILISSPEADLVSSSSNSGKIIQNQKTLISQISI